jgi:hypothetical protein
MANKKTQRVDVLASTKSGRVVVGSMSVPPGTETSDWEDRGRVITLTAAKRLGYPKSGAAERTRVVVGANGKVRA